MKILKSFLVVQSASARNTLLRVETISHPQCRQFFDFDKSRQKIFEQKKLVGYSSDQMYTVVSDVTNYNKFLPFCKKSVVYDRRPGFLKADLVIGFPPLNESYTSHVTLISPKLIKAECIDGRLFNYFLTIWKFDPGLKDIPQSCVIDFRVAFDFKSVIHSQLSNMFFDQIVMQMEHAFIREATNRYGTAAVKSHVLTTRKS